MTKIISYSNLRCLYIRGKKSVSEIARISRCSENKINYWLNKYQIPKRTISEAIYIKHNPKGDPFRFRLPKNAKEAELFGLGIGLYWGEGNKANKNTVRLGNSDANILKVFIKFLVSFFEINKKDLKFHLHIFTDMDIEEVKRYWIRELGIKEKQIYKPLISKSGLIGTYRKKSKYGVMTLYYGNTKVRNKIVHLIENIKPL
jgi:hypothetical protein